MSRLNERVAELARPVCDRAGVYLWDVEYLRDGGRNVLRVYIDSDGGAGVDECEEVSRALDPLLDEADLIDGTYYLEVSTPGMERVLRLPEHFARCMGEDVEVRLFAALDGKRIWRGKLALHSDDETVIDCEDGERRSFPNGTVSRVRLSPDFSKYFQD